MQRSRNQQRDYPLWSMHLTYLIIMWLKISARLFCWKKYRAVFSWMMPQDFRKPSNSNKVYSPPPSKQKTLILKSVYSSTSALNYPEFSISFTFGSHKIYPNFAYVIITEDYKKTYSTNTDGKKTTHIWVKLGPACVMHICWNGKKNFYVVCHYMYVLQSSIWPSTDLTSCTMLLSTSCLMYWSSERYE